MNAILPYHHPDNKHFSLVFITQDEEDYKSRMQQERQCEHVDVLGFVDRSLNEERYGVYTDTHRAPKESPAFDNEQDLRVWLRSEFGSDLPIVQAVYSFYEEIKKEKQNHGEPFEAYKEIELETLPDILNRVTWRQSVPAVGADLLSKFILTHPMPNTNHRTGIVLLDSYLNSYDDSISIPNTGKPGEWHEWASGYVEESKRLLTLRRRYRIFRYAEELGYNVIERKHGVKIILSEYDIHRKDAFDYFTEQHLERTKQFIDTILNKSDAEKLAEKRDSGRETFVRRL